MAAARVRLREPHSPDKMPDITVKTMKGEQFPVTVDDGATVMNLAEKIAEKKPEMEPGSMKLIYAGKILAMDNKLSEYNIASTGFVAVTVSKPKHAGTKARKDPSRKTSREPSKQQLKDFEALKRQEARSDDSESESSEPEAVAQLPDAVALFLKFKKSRDGTYKHPDCLSDALHLEIRTAGF